MIARALKAKFANARYELDSPENQDQRANDESKESDKEDDFVTPAPSVFQTPMLRKTARLEDAPSVDTKQRITPESGVTPVRAVVSPFAFETRGQLEKTWKVFMSYVHFKSLL